MEPGLVGAVAGFVAAIIPIMIGYRSILTKTEHDAECDRRTKPTNDRIDELKSDVNKRMDRLADKQDESTRDLTKQIQEVLRQIKLNGGRT